MSVRVVSSRWFCDARSGIVRIPFVTGEGGQALAVVTSECSLDVLCWFPVVEFAGHVVEGVLDEREVDRVEVGAFG
ncbi:MAG: hypothetical protein OXB90_08240 [Acidimicrobiaceae bacterium]|nr:hypothetical protein [Acidimicrobiaceae bacterium]